MEDIYLKLSREIISGLLDAYADDIYCVVLGGSSGRNEAALLHFENKTILMSDLDMYVIAKRNSKSIRNYLRKNSSNISEFLKQKYIRFKFSPFFHISFSTLTIRSLKFAWKHLRHFEMMTSGKLIFGLDIRQKYVPKKWNLDAIFTNRLILERVFQQSLLYRKIQGEYLSNQYKAYFTCRNIADLATVICYSNNLHIPSYFERARILPSLKPNLERYVPEIDWDKVINIVKLSTNIKLKPTLEVLEQIDLSQQIVDFKYAFMAVYKYLNSKYEHNAFDYSIFSLNNLPLREIVKCFFLWIKHPNYYKRGIFDKCFFNLLDSVVQGNIYSHCSNVYFYRTRHKEFKGELN